METLIFDAFIGNVSGFTEYYTTDGSIYITYNIKSDIGLENEIFKIYALSSKKPFNKPVIADTLEFKSGIAGESRRISRSSLEQNGFSDSDIDTFAVVKIDTNGNAEAVIAACFASLKWDIAGAFLNKSEMNIAKIKDPAERGREVLESIKERTKTKDPAAQMLWLTILSDAVRSMKKSDISPVQGYEWYISEDIRPPVELSAYKHLLFVTEVMTEFDRQGFYLFGVKGRSHTAVAIKSDGFNPFVTASDCAVKIDDYFTVGVYLAPDGQYFEKIRD